MSLSKRLEEARAAYADRDVAASAAAHSHHAIARAREEHGGAGHLYIGDLVFGGLDGIITTFAVVSGVAGAKLGAGVVLVLGLANLLADGLSMAAGSYLSSKSEREYYDRERQREEWEIEHFPEGERDELIEIYQAKGYSPDEAEQLVSLQTRDKKLWADAMMVHELGLLPDDRQPLTSAGATLLAFVVAGSLPLLVYILGLFVPVPTAVSFPVSIVLSGVALFALGAAKVLVTERNWLKSGLEMLVVGGAAAGIAYLIGWLLKGLGV